MKVFKWGDDLAVRLPDVVIETLGLQEGEGVEIHIAGKHRPGGCARAIAVTALRVGARKSPLTPTL